MRPLRWKRWGVARGAMSISSVGCLEVFGSHLSKGNPPGEKKEMEGAGSIVNYPQ